MNVYALRDHRLVRNFIKDRWLILTSMLIVVAMAGVYLLAFFEPTYKSTAKVWIKDTGVENYITDEYGQTAGQLTPLTSAGNPLLTQKELLESRDMQVHLANIIRQERAKAENREVNPDEKVSTKDIIKVKAEPGTDILSVDLKWEDPVIAQKLLSAALLKLDDVNVGINRDIRTKKRSYIDERLTEIEKKLIETRTKIKEYQQGSMTVDIDEQTRELVKLKSTLVARYADAMAAQGSAAGNYSELQGQIGMSPRAALSAVALGSGNEALTSMRTKLAELKHQYAHDSVKLAPTNPTLVSLKDQISALEKQIKTEMTQTLGGRGNTNGPRIYDEFRGNLVRDMATARAQLRGHGSEAAALRASIAEIDQALKEIPQSKFVLDNLKQEERALSTAYDKLAEKQIEARIKEAETPSNVFVVDAPSLPENASFPKPLHVLALSMLLGLMSGLGISALRTYTQDVCEGAAEVERATSAKVLGVMPWLPTKPEETASAGGGKVISINDLAFRNIISNLKLQAGRRDARVLTFTSSSLKKARVSTLYTIASRLSRQGNRVAMIDADFRTSNLIENLTVPPAGLDFSDLILEVDRKIRLGQTVFAEEILGSLTLDQNGVHLALNTHEVDHSYDFFATRGFQHILHVLRQQFDWVLVDTPSAVIAPEFQAVSQMTDGVVLFADKNATYTTLQRLAKSLRENQTPLVGSIIREENAELVRQHRDYSNWTQGGGGTGTGTGTDSNVDTQPNYGVSVQHREPQTAGSLAMTPREKRVEFLGARMDALTMKETLSRIAEAIEKREKLQHVVVNVAKLVQMHSNPKLREAVNNSDLINADGAGIVLGAKLLGVDIPERVAGIDLMQNLLDLANERQYRVFFLGAEEDVVRTLVTKLRYQYRGLKICGYQNGYYTPGQERFVAERVREAKPDILFVGMSSPKKEQFLAEYKDVMDVPFVMGVGGSFDVLAGKVRRAPVWMQQSGMEWVFRLIQEPKRMWKRYLVTNTAYGWMLVNRVVSARMRPAAHV